MRLALIAPMDVPTIQSGSMPASCSAWYTPAWYEPNAPPPCRTSTTWPGRLAQSVWRLCEVTVILVLRQRKRWIGCSIRNILFPLTREHVQCPGEPLSTAEGARGARNQLSPAMEHAAQQQVRCGAAMMARLATALPVIA